MDQPTSGPCTIDNGCAPGLQSQNFNEYGIEHDGSNPLLVTNDILHHRQITSTTTLDSSKTRQRKCESSQAAISRHLCPTCLTPIVDDASSFVLHQHQENFTLQSSQEESLYFRMKHEQVQKIPTDYLAEPSLSCAFLLAVQPSVLFERSARDTVRATWGSAARGQRWPYRKLQADIQVIFVVAWINEDTTTSGTNTTAGRRTTTHLFADIQQEIDLHGDILFVNMDDSYRNLTLKLLSAYQWVKDNCPCTKFVLKVDFDTFVNVPLLLDTLLVYQNMLNFSVVGRLLSRLSRVDRVGKWMLDREAYPFPFFPAYLSGSGYIMSYSALSALVQAAPFMPLIPIEDVFFTGILAKVVGCTQFGLKRFMRASQPEDYCRMAHNRTLLTVSPQGRDHTILWNTFVHRGRCSPGFGKSACVWVELPCLKQV